MEYFTLLNLKKEPFSNSPDPDFFYGSTQHVDCLQKLELTVRLRQGLSVVIGDVGTGKTTLCRQLLRRLSSDEDLLETHLILDPYFSSSEEFLLTICAILGIKEISADTGERQLKEIIKNHLFNEAVEQQKIIAIMIDEGQKLPDYCLEILRELLNYETNDAKLLQIVIFGQKEFTSHLETHANFSDRVATLYHLEPLSFADTRNMIRFRLQQASQNKRLFPELFSFWSFLAIYWATKGYPRKIVMLCSKTLVSLIIQNGSRVSASLVLACSKRISNSKSFGALKFGAVIILLLLFGFAAYHFMPEHTRQTINAVLPDRAILKNTSEKKDYSLNQRAPITTTQESGGNINAIKSAPSISSLPKKGIGNFEKISDKNSIEFSQENNQLNNEGSSPKLSAVSIQKSTRGENDASPNVDSRQSKSNSSYEIIGSLNVGQDEFLSKIIARVYGRFTPANYKKVLLANPWLSDGNSIIKGATIHFPAPDQPYELKSTSSYWLELGQYETLNSAYEVIRNYPARIPPLLMVPAELKDGNLVFYVIYEKHFRSKEAAQQQLALLPNEYRQKAAVLDNWGEGSLLLTKNLGKL